MRRLLLLAALLLPLPAFSQGFGFGLAQDKVKSLKDSSYEDNCLVRWDQATGTFVQAGAKCPKYADDGSVTFRDLWLVDADDDGTPNISTLLSGGYMSINEDYDDDAIVDLERRSLAINPGNPISRLSVQGGQARNNTIRVDGYIFADALASSLDSDNDGSKDGIIWLRGSYPHSGGPSNPAGGADADLGTYVAVYVEAGKHIINGAGTLARFEFANRATDWSFGGNWGSFDLDGDASATDVDLVYKHDANGTGGYVETMRYSEGSVGIALRAADPTCTATTDDAFNKIWTNTTASELRGCFDNDGDGTPAIYQIDMTTPP